MSVFIVYKDKKNVSVHPSLESATEEVQRLMLERISPDIDSDDSDNDASTVEPVDPEWEKTGFTSWMTSSDYVLGSPRTIKIVEKGILTKEIGAMVPEVWNVLDRIMGGSTPDEQRHNSQLFVKEIASALLSKNPHRDCVWHWTGTGGNGKTSVQRLIGYAFGDYVRTMDNSIAIAGDSTTPPEFYRNARMVFFTDNIPEVLSCDSIIKALARNHVNANDGEPAFSKWATKVIVSNVPALGTPGSIVMQRLTSTTVFGSTFVGSGAIFPAYVGDWDARLRELAPAFRCIVTGLSM